MRQPRTYAYCPACYQVGRLRLKDGRVRPHQAKFLIRGAITWRACPGAGQLPMDPALVELMFPEEVIT